MSARAFDATPPTQPPVPAGGATVRIVGCGRSHRRDDQLGLRVADALAARPPPGAAVAASEAPGADLLTDLEGVSLLIVVDAQRAGGKTQPGTRGRWIVASRTRSVDVPPLDELRRDATRSSHFLSVADALTLGAQLSLLPPEVWIYTVAAADFGYGEELTPAVAAAIPGLVARIRDDVAAWRLAEARHA